MINNTKQTTQIRSGLVWILSGLVLSAYGITGLLNQQIPGIEELVAFINAATGPWLYLAAFLAIFIEGLYVVGSVFPGTTLVLIMAILVQTTGSLTFLSIIATMYIGWLFAGVCNVFIARIFAKKLAQTKPPIVKEDELAGITWFPAFRANMEVSQALEGHSIKTVLVSSLKIKSLATLGLIGYALVIPLLIDITQVSNEEGFMSISVFALINFGVGGYKIHQHYKQKTA